MHVWHYLIFNDCRVQCVAQCQTRHVRDKQYKHFGHDNRRYDSIEKQKKQSCTFKLKNFNQQFVQPNCTDKTRHTLRNIELL